MRNIFGDKGVVLQLSSLLSEKQLLVSVAAGVKLKDLQLLITSLHSCQLTCPGVAGHSRFTRVMPNTSAAVGNAASGTPVPISTVFAF
ncbi:pyrroline-5-carboxylate reductase isoform X3 [Olea europaea subsp. europaea]|uniref:Pyrroline-5-carboxylate reductase isoform X3 n=1 Tax=Olea europaea subsp. europaea TaxID=158383 RepID=A0A8S0PFX7_OLEEU|nr:pyrroline-5-carboxylate reductase isoform X3 [Olea europaea subsp. europaea]